MKSKMGRNRIDPDPAYWEEHCKLRAELAANCLKLVGMDADGNSLFRAISD